jgi:hemoglobin-like flavoprotein
MLPATRSALTPTEVGLIRASFSKATVEPGRTSALFYQKLFELDPTVRALFHGDMHEQGRKLIATLAFVVESLDHLDDLLPTVRELGARHVNYGVKKHHYATVGKALLWSLERSVGRSFTGAARAAWRKAFAVLADAMIAAESNSGRPRQPVS